jgi:hypothetical protein
MSPKSRLSLALSGRLMLWFVSGAALNSSAQTSQGATNFSAANSTQVVKVQQTGSGYGLKASTASTAAVGAIFGQATGTSGYNNGVWGRTYSSSGVAVRGEAMSNTGGPTGVAGFSDFSYNGIGVYGHAKYNGVGVFGQIDSLDNSGIGVYGRAGKTCCGIPGVFEQDATNGGGYNVIMVGRYLNSNNQVQTVFTVDSQTVTGPRFWANPDPYGDDLFIGRSASNTSNVFRVDPSGAVYADGGYHTGGADFAEAFDVQGSTAAYAAGDVLTIDQSATRRLTRSSSRYSTLVAGIYSTKPGVLASPYAMDQVHKSNIPLAVVGVVPCKVTTENGAVQPGDLLVTSAKQGYAMKGTDRSRMVGAVLGKALEPLSKGDGIIQVLVTLQ